MIKNYIDTRENSRHMTNVFMGYNHNPVISDGEIYESLNMTTDYYPLLAPRGKRKLSQTKLKGDYASIDPLRVINNSYSMDEVDKVIAKYVATGFSDIGAIERISVNISDIRQVEEAINCELICYYSDGYTARASKSVSARNEVEFNNIAHNNVSLSNVSFNIMLNTKEVKHYSLTMHVFGRYGSTTKTLNESNFESSIVTHSSASKESTTVVKVIPGLEYKFTPVNETDCEESIMISTVKADGTRKIISRSTDPYIRTFTKSENIETVELSISVYKQDVTTIDGSIGYECKRETTETKIIYTLLKDDKLAYLTSDYLTYNNVKYLLPRQASDDSIMVNYGTSILVFPVNIAFDTVTKTIKDLECKVTATTISATLCNASGDAISATASSQPPEDPQNKDYWIDTGENYLYQYSDSLSMWVGIPTSYIKLTFNKSLSGFSEGDAVFISNCPVADVGNGSVIKKISADNLSMVVAGIISESISSRSGTYVIERRVPTLDHVCVSNNRVWGCHYGTSGGKIVNEIYASKLGDPTNWYVYEGISTDSYALSLGDDGEFTGAICYNGYPIFFKENAIYKMYGNYPQAYQLYTYDCRGCQKGSGDSIAILSEYIIYKSRKDVCIFNGESPTGISDPLGLDRYDDASAGVSVSKYYLSMRNKETGKYEILVYDLEKGLWSKEDDLHIEHFAYNKSGLLYGHSDKNLYAFEYDNDSIFTEVEDEVEWMAETGTYNYDYPDHQYLSRLSVRAEIPYHSDITVSISYDDEDYKLVKTLRGQQNVKTQSIAIKCDRCDHYRLKFEGHGLVKIYGITRTFEYGGEKNGCKS